jgi:hypothetical protein
MKHITVDIKERCTHTEALYQSARVTEMHPSLLEDDTKTAQKLANPSTPFGPPGYYCWKC